jgi:hypothetical protein
MNDKNYDDMWYSDGFLFNCAWLRKDTLEECTQKTSGFLQDFIKLYPDWIPFNNSSTFKACRIPLYEVPSLEELKKIIVLGRDKFYETDEHGSRIRYFNWGSNKRSSRNYKKMVEISINCGAYKGFYNGVVIQFPPHNDDAKDIITKEFFKIMFELLLKYWQPLYGKAMFPIRNENLAKYREIGWLTYLSTELGNIPQLPSWAKIIPIEGTGNYIQTTEEISCWENEEDLNKISILSEIITPWLEKQRRSIQISLQKPVSSDIKNVIQQIEKEEVVETSISVLDRLAAKREIENEIKCGQDAVLTALQKKFTKIPANIENFIRQQNQPDVLDAWHTIALDLDCQTLDDFTDMANIIAEYS